MWKKDSNRHFLVFCMSYGVEAFGHAFCGRMCQTEVCFTAEHAPAGHAQGRLLQEGAPRRRRCPDHPPAVLPCAGRHVIIVWLLWQAGPQEQGRWSMGRWPRL